MGRPPVRRFLGDEQFPHAVLDRLAEAGHDTLSVQVAGLSGMPDEAVLEFAAADDRIVLTHDRRDFRRLHRAGAVHTGIIICTRNDDHTALAAAVLHVVSTVPDTHGLLLKVYRGDRTS